MSKVVNLYLYRLQKEVNKALEKGSPAVTPSQLIVDPQTDDCFYYGEHLCLDQIQNFIKSKG